MTNIEANIVRLPHAADLPLPAYASELAAGLDLYAAIPANDPIVLAPGAWATISTGITLALPPGTEGQVRPRSGLAARRGVVAVLQTIDADYRGEVPAILINHGQTSFAITRGMRIAQLVIAPVLHVTVREGEHVDDTTASPGRTMMQRMLDDGDE
jgi:dUTP pyrophosphatase